MHEIQGTNSTTNLHGKIEKITDPYAENTELSRGRV